MRLDAADIAQLRILRNEHFDHELAFIMSDDTISVIEGDRSSVDGIPLDIGIIGHTHPPITKYQYNPPSDIDIMAAMGIPNQDWFIIDELGVWIYRVDIANPNLAPCNGKSANYVNLDKVDLCACALLNGEIDIDQYMTDINRYVFVEFHPYGKRAINLKKSNIALSTSRSHIPFQIYHLEYWMYAGHSDWSCHD